MDQAYKPSRRSTIQPQVLGLFLIGLGLVVLGALMILFLPGSSTNEPGNGASAVPVQVDFPAPALSLQDLEGNAVSLEGFKKQVILLNNWATWCPPCKAEMPTLQKYFENHSQQNFIVLGIEAGEPASDVAEFVENYRLTFPVWPDPEQQATTLFQNDRLPSSYVIDRTGQVRLAWIGAISRAMLEKYVTPLLKE